MIMALSERRFAFEGIDVAYLEGGRGFPVLMIHGSGPGASTAGNWARVLDPLSDRFHIFAMDLIGFGKSARKPAPPYFDFGLWLRQCRHMIAGMPGDRIGIIGHSVSGALALKLAATEPRVAKVLTTGTMGASFPCNEDTARTWTFPRDREALVRTAQGLIADHRLIDDAYLATRERVLFGNPDYAAYFAEMFGGDKQAYIDATVITPDEFARITCDVTMIHGRQDAGFPAGPLTLTIARSIPQADVVLLGRCSHSIAMEHPSKLIEAAGLLFT
jgi:2-hydroxymuconate-semialdehyde hydrolase